MPDAMTTAGPTTLAPSTPTAVPPTSSGTAWSRLQTLGTPAALLILILFFSFATDNFANAENFRNILLQISPLLIVAIGITVPMTAGDYDLSVGANASLAGLVCTGLLSDGNVTSLPVAIAIGLAIGAVIGLLNGILMAYIGFPSLIATLAMMSVLEGLNTAYSGGLSIFNNIPSGFTGIAAGAVLGIPTLTIVTALVAVAVYLLLHRRPSGRHLYAIGSSYGVSRLVGIRISRTRVVAMMISALAAALAGVLLASRLGAGIPNAGDSFLLGSLTIVFLGMTMYRVGRANIPGTIVGGIFYGVLQNGLNIMGVASAGQKLATGFVLMGAVAFAVFRNRTRE